MIFVLTAFCLLGQSSGVTTNQSIRATHATVRVVQTEEPVQSNEDHPNSGPTLIGKVNPLIWAAILLLGSLTALFWFTDDAELDVLFRRNTGEVDQTATREAGTGKSLPISTT